MSLETLQLMQAANRREEQAIEGFLAKFDNVDKLPAYSGMALREMPKLVNGKLHIQGEWKEVFKKGGPLYIARAVIDPKTATGSLNAYVGVCGTGTDVDGALPKVSAMKMLQIANAAIDAGEVAATRETRAAITVALSKCIG